MQLIRGLHQVVEQPNGFVATIGNFDGVHLGHQTLISSVVDCAHKHNLLSLVILFEPQPEEYFCAPKAPTRLTSFKEKWRLLQGYDIDYVCCLPFNQYLAQLSADEFAQRILFEMLQIKYLVIGQDFRFGYQRKGDIQLLNRYAKQYAAQLIICHDKAHQQKKISSTAIRKQLMHNQLGQAAQSLGRAYSIYGRVVYGEQRGQAFGFPTANIWVKRLKLPALGVYCVLAERSCGKVYQGIANIGTRPTVGGQRVQLEVHLFDFSGALYGECLEIHLLHYVRAEQKYASVTNLIQQIKQDVKTAKAKFSNILNTFPVRIPAS